MAKKYAYFLGLVALFFVLVTSACYKSGTMGQAQLPPPAPNNVNIGDNFFDPNSLTVTSGTTVTWTNRGSVSHTVTSDQGTFDSGNLGQGGTFSFTFKDKGTFGYHCNFHSGMTAKIIVQ